MTSIPTSSPGPLPEERGKEAAQIKRFNASFTLCKVALRHTDSYLEAEEFRERL